MTQSTQPYSLPSTFLSSLSNSDPDKWSVDDVCHFIKHVKERLKENATIFKQKGWSQDEVTRYLTELDTQFIIYEEQIRAKNLLGLIVTEFDEGDYKDEFNATIRYHRLALLAYMKLCKQYGKTMG